jgi:hypothetical protein
MFQTIVQKTQVNDICSSLKACHFPPSHHLQYNLHNNNNDNNKTKEERILVAMNTLQSKIQS